MKNSEFLKWVEAHKKSVVLAKQKMGISLEPVRAASVYVLTRLSGEGISFHLQIGASHYFDRRFLLYPVVKPQFSFGGRYSDTPLQLFPLLNGTFRLSHLEIGEGAHSLYYQGFADTCPAKADLLTGIVHVELHY